MAQHDTRPAVVLVTAHPDDVAIFMGGTAWLLKERYQLHVICATRGERGYHWDGPGLSPPNAAVAAEREASERASCALLGASLTFLDQIDGEVFADRERCMRTAALLDEFNPVALFTHGPLEKADHAAVSTIATKALHLTNRFWTTELYLTTYSGVTLNAKFADLYVNISAVLEEKRQLMRCHASHLGEAAIESYLQHNAALGTIAWCQHAEAYQTGLALTATRWNRKAGSILLDLG